MNKISIQDAKETDLTTIHEIESEVYATPWTINFFRIMFHMNNELFIVATDNDELIGYTVGEIEKMGNCMSPKKAGHVLNVAVKSFYQGKGVGTMLLDEIEKRFLKKGADLSYLEVRKSNEKAQEVYKNRGYVYVRTANNYYGDEDGYILKKTLTR